MNDTPEPATPPPKGRRVRIFLVGIGLVLIGLLAWAWMMKTPVSLTSDKKNNQAQQIKPPSEQNAAADPQVVPKTPAQSSADLRGQMEQVLSGIEEANQKNDLPQLLSHYSPNFQQLPQRAQSISKDWKVYDYPKMEFEIKEVRLLPDNTAEVKVTWNVEAQNISTKKIKNVSKSYLTRFVKESGHWRIKALDQIE